MVKSAGGLCEGKNNGTFVKKDFKGKKIMVQLL